MTDPNAAAPNSIKYLPRLRADGRGFVVLGVGSGIGGEVCAALGEAGGRVLCADIDAKAADRAAARCGGIPIAADVTKAEDLARVFAAADAHFGASLYGVVDVVGIPVVGALEQQDDAAYDRQFDLVLRHAVNAVREAAPRLARRGGGSIVLIGSLAGSRSTARLTLYGAAKAALNSFAETAALELGPRGVRVNVVAPGRIGASGTVKPSAESVARIEAAVPLGRLGRPDDIAGVVLFLLSDLSSYVTGVVIAADGGIGPVSALPS